MAYTKLFSSIIHSTIWREAPNVKIVWVTMLALASKRGVVSASVPGLADVSRVSLEETLDALTKLSAPDPFSRSKAEEGRRIHEVDGGWQIINHTYYRELRDEDQERIDAAARQRKHRVAVTQSHAGHTQSRVSLHHTPAPAPAPTDTSTDLSPSAPSEPELVLTRIPRNGTRLASPAAIEVGEWYLRIFNAVYGRRVGRVGKIATMVEVLLRRGNAGWQIAAMPIMVKGRCPDWRPEADHMLRDGSHKHTGPNGVTSGDTDWLSREMLSLDRLVLDARLASIASEASVLGVHVLEALRDHGVGLRKEEA